MLKLSTALLFPSELSLPLPVEMVTPRFWLVPVLVYALREAIKPIDDNPFFEIITPGFEVAYTLLASWRKNQSPLLLGVPPNTLELPLAPDWLVLVSVKPGTVIFQPEGLATTIEIIPFVEPPLISNYVFKKQTY